jgi:hypothetical protein
LTALNIKNFWNKTKYSKCKTIYIIRQEILWGMLMERSEAVNYLKELLRNCTDMSPEAVSFEHPSDYQGYTVRIKGVLYETDKETIRNIAKKHYLSVREEKDELLIFKP